MKEKWGLNDAPAYGSVTILGDQVMVIGPDQSSMVSYSPTIKVD